MQKLSLNKFEDYESSYAEVMQSNSIAVGTT
eukprot:CAMPEP_0201971786 /NCGR_PEP_ID=MMETSP0904-20121228/38789_1 /ASSEMBLY_ACC=CAM_ASM_000553 /TAXON_ID=420261 /ORGANISM="Thalassiosira antarctica, Strain CCMP982" /LENGTH=30 /DNA_ID= /DNA_START= /DNA_END= /DNA_ORIENTATION=